MSGTGSGQEAEATTETQTVVIIRDFQPGQLVQVIFITPEQAQQLPLIPDDALQIAIAPTGGI